MMPGQEGIMHPGTQVCLFMNPWVTGTSLQNVYVKPCLGRRRAFFFHHQEVLQETEAGERTTEEWGPAKPEFDLGLNFCLKF